MYQLREKKNLADRVAIYSRGRELFRSPTYLTTASSPNIIQMRW